MAVAKTLSLSEGEVWSGAGRQEPIVKPEIELLLRIVGRYKKQSTQFDDIPSRLGYPS